MRDLPHVQSQQVLFFAVGICSAEHFCLLIIIPYGYTRHFAYTTCSQRPSPIIEILWLTHNAFFHKAPQYYGLEKNEKCCIFQLHKSRRKVMTQTWKLANPEVTFPMFGKYTIGFLLTVSIQDLGFGSDF